jgi:primosomal protein N' (replication factor Y)
LTLAQLALARWLSGYYLCPLIEALRLMLPVGISQRGRTVFVRTSTPAPSNLSPTQNALLARIAEAEGDWAEISEGLHGVTQQTDLEPLIAMGLVSYNKTDRLVRLLVDTETVARVLPTLTFTQAALLSRIAQVEGTWAEISGELRGVTLQGDLEPLIAADLVTREVAFLTPPPHPKFNNRVRLLADAEAIVRALPALGHPSKRAGVLTWLAKQATPLPSLDDLCTGVGCTEASVRTLAERGWVNILPRRIYIRRTVVDTDLSSALVQLAHAPKQATAMSALSTEWVSEAEFRAAHGIAVGIVRVLMNKGLVERAEEPTRVSLTLAPDAILDALVELRGAVQHRAVLEALQKHAGPAWIGWVYAETGADLRILRDLEAAGLIELTEEMVWRDPLAGHEFTLDQPPVLTEEQERVWEAIRQRIEADKRMTDHPIPNPQSPIYLLHGVTGSGKTEIYLRAIAEVLKRGRQAVVLVPEIALTPQTIRRFAARFPGKVTVWHSELGDGERFDVWRRVRTGHPAAQVVVGSRSALFLPFPDLGLIVLDEEHEPTYKQERTPRYHGRTVAIELGQICGAPVILGSATPALETYYAARRGEIELLTLPKRIRVGEQGGRGAEERGSRGAEEQGPAQSTNLPIYQFSAELPEVQVVDMRQELRVGNRSMFSRALTAALERVLAAKQQAILYLNRRGAATFVLCRDCGHVEACPRCSVPLTYHSAGDTLLCHHCNQRYPVPFTCPECQSKRIRYFGSGTQNLEEAVQTTFPQARTLRWDRDVTGAKGSHDAILSRFTAHEADVLIGTQMIAKGLDLPLVTLVGVIAADVGLFLPDFRAGERTFQLLTQVAGRAGRSALGGQVIVQTYHPDHYAIVAASRHDYEGFYRQEMVFRRQQGYPPIRRLARLEYHHSQRAKAQSEATRLAEQLRGEIARLALPDTDLIGPAPCFFSQQRGEYRWQVVVRSPDPILLLRTLALPLGWRLDIDPVDLL